MTKTIISGQLEVDHERGVIYFHADPKYGTQHKVITALRVCGLKTPVPEIKDRMLDLTAPRCDW